MTNGAFNTAAKKMMQLFKDSGLYKSDLSYNKTRTLKDRDVRILSDYAEYYQNIINKTEYDILLTDDSIIQINRIDDHGQVSYRYMYMQPVYKMIPFDEYCWQLGELNNDDMIEYLKECYAEDGKIKNEFPCYVRYDVESLGYEELVHSYAHIHIGFNNTVRIPVCTIWTPIMFASFIIRQFYPECWRRWLNKGEGLTKLKFKQLCENINAEFWNEREEKDVYLK